MRSGELGSIWGTPEAEAWARDFRYEDYLRLHKEFGVKASPFSIDHYDALCDLFDKIYEDDQK